jgi:L-lactate dehydrogenase (cytochrome)
MTPEDMLENYPAIEDLRGIAKRRIPHFAWEYLDSGTGLERAFARNRQALDEVMFTPEGLKGYGNTDVSTSILNQSYNMPFGIAPVGMTGLMWPGAELMLAKSAAIKNIPYCLSTVACETPEAVGALADGNAWFQLYTFSDQAINADLLKRAADSGFSTLVVTVDVPVPSMRERQRRAGLRVPPKMTPTFLARVAVRPHWALATLAHGKPAFRMMEKYTGFASLEKLAGGGGKVFQLADFISSQRKGGIYKWEDLKKLRDFWRGPIVVKGIMSVEDARGAVTHGMDGIVVSNHGGRQLDAVPSTIEVLPDIARAVKGKTAILFDSGVRTGLDVLRALALGADFVLAGRPYLYGAAALGQKGAEHVSDIIKADLENNMIQLGIKNLSEISRLKPQYPDHWNKS